MKEIRTEDAVGHILCHDITQIIKDEKKGVLFKKGHVVKEEDIPLLLSVGKEHLFVWEKNPSLFCYFFNPLYYTSSLPFLSKYVAGITKEMPDRFFPASHGIRPFLLFPRTGYPDYRSFSHPDSIPVPLLSALFSPAHFVLWGGSTFS